MRCIIFVWDNLGPMHDDRVRAVSQAVGSWVVGLELFGRSEIYAWDNDAEAGFEKVTLFPDGSFASVSVLNVGLAILRECRRLNARHVLFCHYERPAILLAASLLRLTGRHVYVMSCSKFDDYERHAGREWLKRFFFLPYQGAISSGARAADYMRFMGIRRDRIATEYNTLSIDRIRQLAGKEPAPDGVPFAERHFTIVARFVPKKNLRMALDAYSAYCADAPNPRPLHLCGSGPLENELRDHARALGLGDRVVFRGFLQSDGIASVLGDTLALLLPSIEEQFGNVVIEAQAMGLPVILSDNCGARDRLVRSGVNGFVVEPDNPAGLAYFMGLLDRDEALWRRMCIEATASAPGGDVARFAEAVRYLIDRR